MYEAFPKDNKVEWFRWMSDVYQSCMTPDANNAIVRPLTEKCLTGFNFQYKFTNIGEDINWTKYKDCRSEHEGIVQQSLSQNRFVNFLDRDMALFDQIGNIAWAPAITINDEIYQGDLKDSDHLFQALCSIM